VPFVSRAVVERVADCPFSVAHEYAAEFFRGAEDRGIEVRVPLRDFFYVVRGHVRKPVSLVFAAHPDELEGGRGHDALLIEWKAGTRLLPDFHGTLRLRIETVDSTRLTLEGTWRPPLGPFGRVFDPLIGRAIAKATMRDLVGRIAEALERREATYRYEGRRSAPGSSTA
jgi:hypothetical protein